MNSKQRKWDKKFLQCANILAEMSHCQSHKVCAIATIDNRIIETGINGTLPNFTNCDDKFPKGVNTNNREEHHLWSSQFELHAEDNLILSCARNHKSLQNATVYINMQPCNKCTLRLAYAGICRVVYSKPYDKGNIEFNHEIFAHTNIKFDYINLI